MSLSIEAKRAYHREYMRARHASNPDLAREASRRWREKNKDRSKERCRQWRAANRERVADYNRDWKKANPDYQASWRDENLDRARAYLANYRGRKAHATPAWADAEKIAAIYAEATRLTAATGIPHEVDHEIPLNGRNVCGLHVESNLRVITASANRKKGNRFDG